MAALALAAWPVGVAGGIIPAPVALITGSIVYVDKTASSQKHYLRAGRVALYDAQHTRIDSLRVRGGKRFSFSVAPGMTYELRARSGQAKCVPRIVVVEAADIYRANIRCAVR